MSESKAKATQQSQDEESASAQREHRARTLFYIWSVEAAYDVPWERLDERHRRAWHAVLDYFRDELQDEIEDEIEYEIIGEEPRGARS